MERLLFYATLLLTGFYVVYVFSEATECEKAGGVLVLTIADFVCVKPLEVK